MSSRWLKPLYVRLSAAHRTTHSYASRLAQHRRLADFTGERTTSNAVRTFTSSIRRLHESPKASQNATAKLLPSANPPSTAATSSSGNTVPPPTYEYQSQPQEARLSLTFTCTVEDCGTRSTHEFTKRSYTRGIVIVQCPGCENRYVPSPVPLFVSVPACKRPHDQRQVFCGCIEKLAGRRWVLGASLFSRHRRFIRFDPCCIHHHIYWLC